MLHVTVAAGKVAIDQRLVTIPNFHLNHVLGSGASGVVFHATHSFTKRDEAIKIWLTLRDYDDRDKVVQGIFETQKMALAESNVVVPVYTAGMIDNDMFYMSMKYIAGKSLKHFMSYKLNGTQALHLAHNYVKALRSLSLIGVIHGDPHPGNVLLQKNPSNIRLEDPDEIAEYLYGGALLCDLGTSRLFKTGSFVDRNWNVAEKTLNRLLKIVRTSYQLPSVAELSSQRHIWPSLAGELSELSRANPKIDYGRSVNVEKVSYLFDIVEWLIEELDH